MVKGVKSIGLAGGFAHSARAGRPGWLPYSLNKSMGKTGGKREGEKSKKKERARRPETDKKLPPNESPK